VSPSEIMNTKKRILFLIRNLQGGGAERSFLNIIVSLDRQRYEPHLVMWQQTGAYLDELPTDVPLYILPAFRLTGVVRHIRHIRALAALIEMLQPEVVLSFLDGSNVLALETKLVKNPDCVFIISQRNNLSVSFQRRYQFKGLRRWLKIAYVRWLYPRADHIISLSHGVKTDLVANFGLPADRITPVHNPIDIQKVIGESDEPVTYPWKRSAYKIVISVGRLSEQKGYADLIDAFSRLENVQHLKLVILGEGELRGQLEALIASKGLQHAVWMPGFVENPWAYLHDADIFVLASHWEGFGNVIVEAMACDTPVIVTDCDYGPREIITHGMDGILVPVGDVERLADELDALLADKHKQRALSGAGKVRASKFERSRITRQYEKIFEIIVEADL
jgi:glycosyltransferase involved in cell wall biosynthesis